MQDDIYVQDGVVYPDEATAVVAMHPNIPEELKRVFITKPDEKPDTKDNNVYEPPTTLDQNILTPRGLEGNRQFQQDPELETTIQYPTPDYLNPPERGPGFEGPPRPPAKVLFKTSTGVEITDHDIDNAIGIVTSTGPLAIGKVPPHLQEIFPNLKVNKVDPFEQVPYGYTKEQWHSLLPVEKQEVLASSHTDKIMEELKKVLDQYETELTPKIAKKIPITEGKFNSYIDMVLENHFDKLDKPSPKEAFKQGVQKALDDFQSAASEAKNKMMNALRGPVGDLIKGPKVEPRGEYTEPAYRGLSLYGKTAEPNPVFKYEKAGNMYSTADPMLADMYAGYLSTHPGIKVPPGEFSAGSQVMPLMINTKDYHYFDAKGAIWQKANPKAIQEAHEAGKKGVIVDNVWDEPNSTTALGKPNKIYITFPSGASTVKSRFAKKFDPSSENIMHGIGTIGIGTAAAGYISTEQKE